MAFGWRNFWTHWKLLVGATIFVAGFPLISTIIVDLANTQYAPFAFVLNLILWALQLILALGTIKVYLSVVDSQPTNFAQLFSPYRLVFKYLIATFISGLAILIGLTLLIIPGIIVAIKLQFWQWAMVDKNLGVRDSLRESWQITKGVKLNLLLFNILLMLITIVGALFLGVGLLVAVPVTQLATAYVYRRLSSRT